MFGFKEERDRIAAATARIQESDAMINKMLEKNREESLRCEQVWKKTLEHFKIFRPVLPYEHMKIAQLVKQYGEVAVTYALTGMRFEERTKNFDPAKHVALSRAQDLRMFEIFVNLAAREKTLQEEKK